VCVCVCCERERERGVSRGAKTIGYKWLK